MIVPMKKVSLVILEREKDVALKTLRKAGIVHLQNIEGASEKLSEYKTISAKLEDAYSLLSEVKKPKKGFVSVQCSNEDALKKAECVLEITEKKKNLLDKISNNANEIERLAPWGIVDPKDFEYLEQKGIFLSLYEMPTDKMRLIPEDLKTLIVNSSKSTSRFLLISSEKLTERPATLPPEAFSVVLPDYSTVEIAKEIENCNNEIKSLEKEFIQSASYMDAISAYDKILKKDIEFENIASGMETDAQNGEEKATLAWLQGFVPQDSIEMLKKVSHEQNWALAFDDPSDEDDVPTKLKNNKFVSLIYPLTDFLGTVPGYREYDISGWFLFFFTIFFGMIFGDGGYGLLITIVGLIMLLKSAKSKKSTNMAELVLLLGCATMIWGAVTCTWFGLTPEQLPTWIKALSVPQISNAYANTVWYPFWAPDGSSGSLTTENNLQIFCFTLALFQLCVAHIKGIGRYAFDKNYKKNNLKWIGEFGSLVQLVGMYWVVLSMVVSSEVFPLLGGNVYGIPAGTVAVCLVLGGFLLSFVFANYEGSIGKSILESVKNIISVLLGVVNVFSDIVSYIRLWAVGLAGAAISNTVNTMAGPLLGKAIMFGAFLLLIIGGHGLNMILNLLSVIVHGVRLNTLEFSNHIGMSWSGFKYEPFSETVNK